MTRLATIRTGSDTRAVRMEGDRAVETGHADVGALLADPDWTTAPPKGGVEHDAHDLDFAPLVTSPGKVICVGANYRLHIEEMGRELPQYPTLFAKFTEALIGAHDDIDLPPESEAVDWEAELAVVIGQTIRRADEQQAAAAIAGFTVMNDISMRDWQRRTLQWLQGKSFEASTPLGPVLATPDEVGGTRPELRISCTVDGEVMQDSSTADLVFDAVDTVQYVSTFITLKPGDVIATGTPGGVGHARKPPRYLTDGNVVVTEIEGIGRLENTARRI